MKLFLWNYGMFVTKSCVKKFGGGNINEIYSGTISYAEVNTILRCLTSDNKIAIKLTMQSTDAEYNIQHKTCEVHPDYPQLYLN